MAAAAPKGAARAAGPVWALAAVSVDPQAWYDELAAGKDAGTVSTGRSFTAPSGLRSWLSGCDRAGGLPVADRLALYRAFTPSVWSRPIAPTTPNGTIGELRLKACHNLPVCRLGVRHLSTRNRN